MCGVKDKTIEKEKLVGDGQVKQPTKRKEVWTFVVDNNNNEKEEIRNSLYRWKCCCASELIAKGK